MSHLRMMQDKNQSFKNDILGYIQFIKHYFKKFAILLYIISFLYIVYRYQDQISLTTAQYVIQLYKPFLTYFQHKSQNIEVIGPDIASMLEYKIKILESENALLKSTINSGAALPFQNIIVEVIGYNHGLFGSKIIINYEHANRDIKLGALAHDGYAVIGKVIKIGKNIAWVATINDIDCKIPIILNNSRVKGIAIGGEGNNKMRLQYLNGNPHDDKIAFTATTAFGPKGLYVGNFIDNQTIHSEYLWKNMEYIYVSTVSEDMLF